MHQGAEDIFNKQHSVIITPEVVQSSIGYLCTCKAELSLETALTLEIKQIWIKQAREELIIMEIKTDTFDACAVNGYFTARFYR